MSKLNIEYVVVTANSTDYLEDKVTELLKDGFEPVGGIAFNSGSSHQAMIRRSISS